MQHFDENDLAQVFQSLAFAARKHKNQRRKGEEHDPYINHPIEVAELLYSVGQVRDVNLLLAAILHDTVEDTQTTPEELGLLFGSVVRDLVLEVSDDKSLPKLERKRLQVVHAPHKSVAAKQLKLADKICNIRDVVFHPPESWSEEQRIKYVDWAAAVAAGLHGVNPALESEFEKVVILARQAIEDQRTQSIQS